jgi:hypothetical protein
VHKFRSVLALSAAVAAVAAGAAVPASATVKPADASKPLITVVVKDRAGDVRMPKVGKADHGKVTQAQRKGTDVRNIKYRLDRTAQTLIVVYKVRKTVLDPQAAQVFSTALLDPTSSDPLAMLSSTAGTGTVVVFGPGGSTAQPVACDAATAQTLSQTNRQVVTVPFSCLSGLTEARLASVVGLVADNLLAADRVTVTRSLPFTQYAG